jgi:hypothetical protein
VFVAISSTLLIFAGPGNAEPALACGQLVTTDVTLTADLLGCPGDGLIVGASDVTVDLNGHSITGSDAGAGVLIGSAKNVSVINGSIRGFEFGIRLFAGPTRIEGLTISSNDTGVSVDAGEATIVDNTIAENANYGIGVALMFGGRGDVSIVHNRVVRNGGTGIVSGEDSVRLVQDNVVSNNGGDGIRLFNTVAVVAGNSLFANANWGLNVAEFVPEYVPRYFIADNVADRNGVGGMTMLELPYFVEGPGGDGNAAKLNALVQCEFIVCAFNRGLARQDAPPADSVVGLTH